MDVAASHGVRLPFWCDNTVRPRRWTPGGMSPGRTHRTHRVACAGYPGRWPADATTRAESRAGRPSFPERTVLDDAVARHRPEYSPAPVGWGHAVLESARPIERPGCPGRGG
jgi:hypothetical protein